MMKVKRLVTLSLLTPALTIATGLNGAGSSAIAPLIQSWAKEYSSITGININYQAVGSGAGIRMVSQRMVDFGASDAPLKPNELKRKNLMQYPIAAFGVVVVYNLPKLEKLSTETLCGIFSGKIRFWDDPLIKRDNPSANLPHLPIIVVTRADKSGTTYTFTSYLVKACGKQLHFHKPSKKPRWWIPHVEGKGNSGVAAIVQQKFGTIGYVEYTYAVKGGLKVVKLENKDGNFVAPSLKTFQEALKYANWGPENGFYADLTYQPGSQTWPIVGATWALVPKERKEKNKLVFEFFNWGYTFGDKKAEELFYAPLPEKVKQEIREMWNKYLYNY
jgi:phosphate transport system substrate-binding protein